MQICPLQHQVKDYSEQVLECALLPVWASINKACLSSCTFLNVLQRFFVNEAYWQHPDGPVFLYIGGEGPLVEYDVLTGSVKYSTYRHLFVPFTDQTRI